MENKNIELLQFFISEDFEFDNDDGYLGKGIRSNIYAPNFPYNFENLFCITCWKKDDKFHKEVLEYTLEDGTVIKTPHMDIEPVTDNVLFRWHKHKFPSRLQVKKDGLVKIKVILDWEVKWDSYVMVEKR